MVVITGLNSELLFMKKDVGNSSFAELAISHRKTTNLFLEQVNQLINWNRVDSVIDNYDTRGKGIAGNSAYPGLVLFKMSLLGIWYKLSDRSLEERVNDSISFNRFCGLSLSDPVPDHSIISRFRTLMTRTGGWDALFSEINRQLDENGLIVKTGTLVDASITESPRKPRRKPEFELEIEPIGNENKSKDKNQLKAVRVLPSRVDAQAGWTKKAGKYYYGYKRHHATDLNGLITAVKTTSAKVHDSQLFIPLIDSMNLEKGTRCYADKGYVGKDRNDYLKQEKLKNGIMDKAYRNTPLSGKQKKRNKLISKVRYIVERTFGGQKKWFAAGITRYVGEAATHTQHLIEAICYNLKRAPRLYVEKLFLDQTRETYAQL